MSTHTLTSVGREPIEIPAGTVIFREGDAGDEMFIIARGRVRLSLAARDHDEELAVLEAGNFFGELSLLSGARRTATATTLDDCVLFGIRREVFAMMMQDDLDVVFRMMDALGTRLTQTDQRIHRLVATLARVRMIADLLNRCLAAEPGGGVTVAVDDLRQAWDATPDAVAVVLRDLAAEGIGTLEGGRWRAGADAARRLAHVLAQSAD
jgi:CRP/FNR family cyclic AMP-dependent transcriptional regulator